MKLKSILIGVVMILCAGLAIFALTKWHRDFAGGDDEGGSSDEVKAVVTVQVGALKQATLHQFVHGYGTVEAAPATADQPSAGGPLAAPSAGVVSKVNVVAGQSVAAGEVLLELNSGMSSHANAVAAVERQKKLFADQNTSLKNVQDAESLLASLQVVAPTAGTVTRIAAKVGAAVDVNTIVAEVMDLNRLAVSAQIPATEAGDLKPGQSFQIKDSTIVPLSYVSPTVDSADGTVLIRALLPPDSGLRPGEFVPVKVVTAVHTNCLVAPAESVVTDEDEKSFIVLVHGEEAAQVPVTTGLREDGWVEVAGADLKEGAPVVTVGAYGFPQTAKIRDAKAAPAEPVSTNSAPAK